MRRRLRNRATADADNPKRGAGGSSAISAQVDGAQRRTVHRPG